MTCCKISYVVNCASEDLSVAYEELPKVHSPDSETRCRVDTSGAVTKMIVESAKCLLAFCTDTGSAFSSIVSHNPEPERKNNAMSEATELYRI